MATAPVLNQQQAGAVATSADMNLYSAACRFLMKPPMVSAGAAQSAQTLTTGVATSINWAAPSLDNDGTWASGSPSVFTIGTYGWYEVNAQVMTTVAVTAATATILVTNGASNPNGAGSHSWWHGSGVAPPTGAMVVGTAGLIPAPLYPGDTIAIQVTADVTGTTTSLSLNSVVTWSTYSHMWVSA